MKALIGAIILFSSVSFAQISPPPGGGSGSVTSVATTAPISGGTFTTTGTIACATCATSSAGGRYFIPFTFFTGPGSPASATTYYFGQWISAANTTNTLVLQLAAPVACTITGGSYSSLVTGTKDSGANNVTLKVYNLTTSTAYTDTAGTVTEQTNTQHSTTFTGANDSVAAGDNLLIQVVTPTFSTLPINVYFQAVILCQP